MNIYLEYDAVLSDCKTYRYRLWRYWSIELPPLCFVMLNPSTADGQADDATIRKCVGFAKRNGFGGIEIVNLFAYRATDPNRLLAARDVNTIIGEKNDATILDVAHTAVIKGGCVVVAWGAHAAARRDDRANKVLSALFNSCIWPYALGFSKSGYPNHPLMLSYDREMVEVKLA